MRMKLGGIGMEWRLGSRCCARSAIPPERIRLSGQAALLDFAAETEVVRERDQQLNVGQELQRNS